MHIHQDVHLVSRNASGLSKFSVVPFVNEETLNLALDRLHGTAGHLLKIWLVLKHMGLKPGGSPLEITTSNSTESLARLFSFGDPDGRFFIPFSHTPRYYTMKSDASRSVIQTTIRRWCTSGSVVTCDPSAFLRITDGERLTVECSRRYPLGLGYGENGFAIEENRRVSIPRTAFAIWYGRQSEIPEGEDPKAYLVSAMEAELNLSPAEINLVFVEDDLGVGVATRKLSDFELHAVCSRFIEGAAGVSVELIPEDYSDYVRRVRTMTPQMDTPPWLRANPDQDLDDLISDRGGAILLYGPPRTGKTRAIDRRVSRNDPRRATIQIHDGWTYDNLVEGMMPNEGGHWTWTSGPLKRAIEDGKEFIVLEEVNRTSLTQALGELFSLIERDYRGEQNAILLRSGERFWIPEYATFILTMNTVDKSTEEVDDALLGRVASIEFPPDSGSLVQMLAANEVPADICRKIANVYTAILDVYPLGHGYLSSLKGDVTSLDVAKLYRTRIRPVVASFLGELRQSELTSIENLLGELFELA